LVATRAWAEASLRREGAAESAAKPYLNAADLAEPLQLCHRSLEATGNVLIAAGRLTDLLRRVAAFGVTLARLDLRQEADRHTEAVDWIVRTLGFGTYAGAAEADRQSLLVRELELGRIALDAVPLDAASPRVK